MEGAPGAIGRLPRHLQARVRAQHVVSSLAEALAECVGNSLDAGASEVNVELDLAALGFRVQDNGSGVAAPRLALLAQQLQLQGAVGSAGRWPASASSGGLGSSSGRPARLGYRGEALAAICATAATVELTSRAAGSFETHCLVLRRGSSTGSGSSGGVAAQLGLALEQRSRQGSVLSVRNMFFNQPVRRKALLAAGLPKEADRCREALVRLALLRPHVTLTLYDRGRKAFLLRLLKGRSQLEGVADFLGQPPQLVAALPPVPGGAAAFAVYGYAVLPPHGHPNASRQCVHVNGRWVKAPPVSKLIDGLYQQLLKPTMRAQQPQAEELQQVHKAANRHAAFVLQISCGAAEYELAHEAEGDLVEFRDWEALLAAVRRALLEAWRLVLSNSLLKQLEQLERQEGGDAAAGASLAAAAGGTAEQGPQPHQQQQQSGSSFQHWLQQQAELALADLPLPASSRGRGSGQQQAAPASGAAAASAPAAAGSGGRQRGKGSGRQLAGAKHTLASRLVRYNGATAVALAAPSAAAEGVPTGQPLARSGSGTLACEGAAGGSAALSKRMRASVQTVAPQQEQAQHLEERAWQASTGACGAQVLARLHPMQKQQEQEHGQRQRQQQQHLRQPPQEMSSDDEVDALISSWQPVQQLPPRQQAREGSRHWGSAAGATTALTAEERQLLNGAAAVPPSRRLQQRAQSAPPHRRQRKHTVRAWQAMASSGPAPAGQEPLPAGVACRAAAAEDIQPERLQQQPATVAGQPDSRAAPPAAKHGSSALPAPEVAGSAASVPGQGVPTALPAALPASEQPLPDFLRPDAGLDMLLASWRQPAGKQLAAAVAGGAQAAASGGGSGGGGILTLEALAASVLAQLKPVALTRQQLAAGRALRQVDSKFIPVVAGSLLLLVDQHAADERVQLEELRDQLLGPGGQQPLAAYSQALRAPLPLGLTVAEQQLLEAYAHKVAAWGWRWQPGTVSGGGGSGPEGPLLTHAPLLWGTALSATDLKLYLHHLDSTCGAGGLPAGVVRVLNSKACRSAVMFGDSLEEGQCQQLLERLKQTQLCFSCAHGRPTTAPVADLQLLRRAVQLRADAQLPSAKADSGAGAAETGPGAGAGSELSGLKSKVLLALGSR